MYRVEVIYPGAAEPAQIRSVPRGGDVLSMIPQLLKTHPQCERILVWVGFTRLFAVDCNGNRIDI